MKKYTDVDIIAELQKLVDSHVDSYKEDFGIVHNKPRGGKHGVRP